MLRLRILQSAICNSALVPSGLKNNEGAAASKVRRIEYKVKGGGGQERAARGKGTGTVHGTEH